MTDHSKEIKQDRLESQNKINIIAIGLIALNSTAITITFSGATKFDSYFIWIISCFLLSIIIASTVRIFPFLQIFEKYKEREETINENLVKEIDTSLLPDYELHHRAYTEGDETAHLEIVQKDNDNLISQIDVAQKELKALILIIFISFFLFLAGIFLASIVMQYNLK